MVNDDIALICNESTCWRWFENTGVNFKRLDPRVFVIGFALLGLKRFLLHSVSISAYDHIAIVQYQNQIKFYEFLQRGRAGWSPRSTCWLQLKLPAVKYYNSILYWFYLLFWWFFQQQKKSMKHSMTLNRTAVSSNLICDLCFFSLRIATSLELLDDES